MKILITGATGYVGSNLLKKMSPDDEVTILINRPIADNRFHQILTEDDWVSKLHDLTFDCVIHLATKYVKNDRKDLIKNTIESNILFPILLYENLNGDFHFINICSIWERLEVNNRKPNNFYSYSKAAFKKYLDYKSKLNSRITNLYIGDTFGPGDKRPKLINYLLDAALNGKILDMTGAEQYLNLTHINDVCDAICYIYRRKIFGDYQLDPKFIKVIELVEIIERIAASKVANIGVLEYGQYEVFDPSVSIKLLEGFTKKIDIEVALKELINES